MRLSFLLGLGAGYVLGAKAGTERYEQIVAFARKVAGSQTVQSAAGVMQAQFDDLRGKAKDAVTQKLHVGGAPANGYRFN